MTDRSALDRKRAFITGEIARLRDQVRKQDREMRSLIAHNIECPGSTLLILLFMPDTCSAIR